MSGQMRKMNPTTSSGGTCARRRATSGRVAFASHRAFLRNGHRPHWLEGEAEGLGAPTQVADDPRTITGLRH
jgi:hypothetical protein